MRGRPLASPSPTYDSNGALALAEPIAIEPPPPPRHAPAAPPLETRPPLHEPPSPRAKESDALAAWRTLIDRVRKASPPVAATLDLAVPVMVTPEKVVVGVEDDSFENVRAEQTDAQSVLTEQARAYFGVPTQVVFERAARGSKVASIAYVDAARRKQMQIDARAAVENHVLVQHAIRVFGGELKDVKLPTQEE
ncbi:MAG TPA: hypothetical protein VM580_11675 [Labilithrix sp.]|nr:hypothetical protein [Labilithrix sp.]